MKRTPLKRKTPLRRSSRLRSHRRRVPHVTLEDKARLDWLHEQPCAVTGRRPVDVHHNTYGRALGRKTPHSQGIPENSPNASVDATLGSPKQVQPLPWLFSASACAAS